MGMGMGWGDISCGWVGLGWLMLLNGCGVIGVWLGRVARDGSPQGQRP